MLSRQTSRPCAIFVVYVLLLTLCARVVWRHPSCVVMQQRLTYETVMWYLDNVFARYPTLFGPDSAAQRDLWTAELLWSITIIDTRAYGGRFPSDGTTLIPFLDLLNHQNNGSFSGHSVPSPDRLEEIVSYFKHATMDYEPVRPLLVEC